MMEAEIEFCAHDSFERELAQLYNNNSKAQAAAAAAAAAAAEAAASEGVFAYLPRVAIYHGLEDAHAPPSHGSYIHSELLKNSSLLINYDSLAHMSLFVEKVDDYVDFVAQYEN